MAKNIWIVNENLSSPDLSENGHSRHYSLAKEFIENGYDLTLITSSFSHNPIRKVPLIGLMKVINGNIRTLVIKGFGHQKSTSIVRILNWFLFSFLLFFAPITRLPRPDVIILSSSPMLPVYNMLFFKWIFPKCKFIFETRDLWPLTPKSIGNYSEKSLFIRLLTHLEYTCYTKADYVVSVIKNSNKHIEKLLGNRKFKFKWISNGIDLNDFSNNQVEKNWNFKEGDLPKDAFLVGYAGTLGKANAMEHIIDTFNSFFKGSKYYLIIVGEGGEKDFLIKRAEGNRNILFKNSVNRDFLLSFYRKCDVLYLSWRDLELYKYGVSARKIFEYMYSKRPILMSCNIPNNIIEEANCGLITKPENELDIKQKILEFELLSEEMKMELGLNGYSFLIENLTYRKLAVDYVNVFKELGV